MKLDISKVVHKSGFDAQTFQWKNIGAVLTARKKSSRKFVIHYVRIDRRTVVKHRLFTPPHSLDPGPKL